MAKLRTDAQKKESLEKPLKKTSVPSSTNSKTEPKTKVALRPPADVPTETANERIGYLLQSPPGLAKVLQKELNFVGATARDQKMFVKLQRNHDLLFVNHVKSDERLSELRTAETVLRCPAYGRFKISQRQLSLMADELRSAGPRRLVVTVAGSHFQRQDLARFLTKSMRERDYDFDEEIEDEVWMFCIDESWYFGLPLFKARHMAHRNERAAEREGSLPPPIAAAMAFASVPRNEDVVLDPTCGSGTLLAEFRSYAPDAKLIGRDIDANAIQVAQKNLNETSSILPKVDLAKGDSRKLSDVEPCVTLTMANLPFGVQFGDKASNPELYRDLLRESLRLHDPEKAWRGLFLTSDADAFTAAVRDVSELTQPEILFRAKVRGELATCFRVKLR